MVFLSWDQSTYQVLGPFLYLIIPKKKKKHYSLSYVAVFKGNLNSENSYKVSDIPILGSKHLPSARFLPLYHNQKKNSDSLSFLYSLYKGSLCGK
jgi:hypothetical protein